MKKGDSKAFESLVRRHVRAAHGLAMSIVHDPDEADDICQDGFVAALQSIHKLRTPDRFRGWLLSIIRNRALNACAFRSRRSGPRMDDVRIPSEAPGPDSGVEWTELMEDVRSAAEELTETQRKVFLLHDVEGYNHEEVAVAMGISRGASRVHLHMARRAVRARLSHAFSEEA